MPSEETDSRARLGLPDRNEWGLKPKGRGGSGWKALVALLLVAVLALEVLSLLRTRGGGGDSSPSAVSGEPPAAVPAALADIPLKDLSARLQRQNLPAAAANVLESYLRTLPAEAREERRKTLVTLGGLRQKAREYEAALVSFYQAELLNPDPQSQTYIDRQVRLCLEKLGKFDEAGRELADRTDPERKPGSPTGRGSQEADRVVARIGVETITAAELSAMIAERVDLQLGSAPGLGEEERQSYRERMLSEYQAPQRRLQALQEMVARKILYREGASTGLDRSARVERELERLREEVVAREVIEQAMAGVEVSASDIRLLYQAEPERFQRPAAAEIRLAVLPTADAAKQFLAEIDSEEDFERMARERSTHAATRESGGLLPQPLVAGSPIAGLGTVPAFERAVFATAAGAPIAAAVALSGGAHAVAFVRRKTPATTPPFEEVRDQVAREYARRKQAETQQELIASLFEKHSVLIHTEAFLKDGGADNDDDVGGGGQGPATTAPDAGADATGGAAPASDTTTGSDAGDGQE
jgi:hypothetical protein